MVHNSAYNTNLPQTQLASPTSDPDGTFFSNWYPHRHRETYCRLWVLCLQSFLIPIFQLFQDASPLLPCMSKKASTLPTSHCQKPSRPCSNVVYLLIQWEHALDWMSLLPHPHLLWFQILNVNVKAPALLLSQLLPHMENRGWGQGRGEGWRH